MVLVIFYLINPPRASGSSDCTGDHIYFKPKLLHIRPVEHSIQHVKLYLNAFLDDVFVK